MISKRVIAELCLVAREEVRDVARAWAANLGRDPDDPTLVAALYEAFLLGLPSVPKAELVLTRQGRAALSEIPNLQLVQSAPTVRLRGGDESNLYCDGSTLEQAAANLRLLFHGMRLGRVLRYDARGDIVTADAESLLVAHTPRLPRRTRKKARTGGVFSETGGGPSSEQTPAVRALRSVPPKNVVG